GRGGGGGRHRRRESGEDRRLRRLGLRDRRGLRCAAAGGDRQHSLYVLRHDGRRIGECGDHARVGEAGAGALPRALRASSLLSPNASPRPGGLRRPLTADEPRPIHGPAMAMKTASLCALVLVACSASPSGSSDTSSEATTEASITASTTDSTTDSNTTTDDPTGGGSDSATTTSE